MVTRELVAYIARKNTEGSDRETVCADLYAQGWSKNDVSAAYTLAESERAPKVVRVAHISMKRPRRKSVVLSVVVLFMCVVGVGGVVGIQTLAFKESMLPTQIHTETQLAHAEPLVSEEVEESVPEVIVDEQEVAEMEEFLDMLFASAQERYSRTTSFEGVCRMTGTSSVGALLSTSTSAHGFLVPRAYTDMTASMWNQSACQDSTDRFVAWIPSAYSKEDTVRGWCVDASGVVGLVTENLRASLFMCPAAE